jgi:hypothetical protein
MRRRSAAHLIPPTPTAPEQRTSAVAGAWAMAMTMTMTRQYLAGVLSVLLGQLGAAAGNGESVEVRRTCRACSQDARRQRLCWRGLTGGGARRTEPSPVEVANSPYLSMLVVCLPRAPMSR